MDAQSVDECRHCGCRPLPRDAPYCRHCGGDEPVVGFFREQERRRWLAFVVIPLSIVATVATASAVILLELLLSLR